MSRRVIVQLIVAILGLTILVLGCQAAPTPVSPPALPQTNSPTLIAIDPTLTSTPPRETPVPLVSPTPSATHIPPASPTPMPRKLLATPDLSQDFAVKKEMPSDASLFEAMMTPFANEAKRRRAELAKSDPDFYKRVDKDLNEGRVNFLLFGYGESHEPPATEKAIIGSHTIVSYNLRTHEVDLISLTHDIRGPEIEREMLKRGYKSPAIRIDQAYNVGGFKLMRQLLENATGLSMDFQVTFRDVVMQRFVDSVFDGVDVNVPSAFDVHAFYLDGKKYDAGRFSKGPQKLNGRQVIQFIKTVPIAEGMYDKSLEHNARKAMVIDALLAALSQKYKDRTFWLKGTTFVTSELVNGAIVYDFDPMALMVNNVGSTMINLQKLLAAEKPSELKMPKINQSRYIVDPAHGDGGVQWVNANAAVNPITKKDIDTGVYPALDVEVPINSNPYGDLVTEYWPSVRQLVKKTLETTQAPKVIQ